MRWPLEFCTLTSPDQLAGLLQPKDQPIMNPAAPNLELTFAGQT